LKLTTDELVDELSVTLDRRLAKAAIESFTEMQQRFLAGDWKPAELDGGRLCEAISRCLLELDLATVDHSLLPGAICDKLADKKLTHTLSEKDRDHLSRVIRMAYKFRSDRGAVHISPTYTANFMDAMLILHAGKWLLGELLRLAWNKDRDTVAVVIAQLVQLEHSLVHELDGKPLVLARGISAPDEILILLYSAAGNRLSRAGLREYARQKPQTVNMAISRLIKDKYVRSSSDTDVALTPLGQARVLQTVLPKWTPTT
jgi:hypothetical protein